ncbi:glycoside hydrolase family 108 protein [Microvirga yunnanensis]|uniref:glycoside hydrolase family 108 protein n=1 Tax=Microvirga yunnanensis TaxID=2953740 RepID=UPI0021C6628B|nr:glycoside hydrolase family 108 protein [Microvirga sp. HBU67655]
MATDRYQASLKIVLVHEGGYVNHPKDPGGATNKGVTQRVYDGYRKRNGLPVRSVKFISDKEVAEIAKRQYWDAVKGDLLPAGVDFVLFDGAYNSGPSQSIKWAQRAVGVKVDGILGEATLAAIENHPDHDKLIAEIIARRLGFLKALRTWPTFGKGWGKRVEQVQATGQAWASGSVAPKSVYFAGMEAKAAVEDGKTVNWKGVADFLFGGGVVTATLTKLTDSLTPLTGALPGMETTVAVLTAGGAVLAAGGVLYRLWAASKEGKLADALDLKVTPATQGAN